MSHKISKFNELVDEFESYKKEFFAHEEKSKNQINSFKKELELVKEINDKTKDYLLLELESNLDKQKEFQIKQESYSDLICDAINVFKDENNNKMKELSILNEEIGKFKQILKEKNELITKLNSENVQINEEFRYNLADKNNTINKLNVEINQLNDEINMLNETNLTKNNTINLLNDKIYLYQKDFTEKINTLEDIISLKDNQMISLDKKISQSNKVISEKIKEIEYLNIKITEFNNKIDKISHENNELKNTCGELENQLKDANSHLKDNIYQLNSKNLDIHFRDNQLVIKDDELINIQSQLNLIKQQNIIQMEKLDNNEYYINSYKNEIDNNQLEISYLKKNNLTRKLSSPFAYLYLLFKSKPNELYINYKLYKSIRNEGCFDVGYYLNNNEDLQESKWCKYFSLELHYVCYGFSEGRKFNKKYFNSNSKKELLDYIQLAETSG